MIGYLAETYQYFNGEVSTNSITAILISGDVEVELEISHGCDPSGIDMTVTKAGGNFILEIDGKPAWEVFRQYLDGKPENLSGPDVLHLSIGQKLEKSHSQYYDDYIIRTPLALDKERGALSVATEIKTGSKIRMTRRVPERVAKNVLDLAASLKEKTQGKVPIATLHFDCAGRGKFLVGIENETNTLVIEPLQKILGHEQSWIGFHTYGEIAPINGKTEFHNYTAVICRIFEK